MVIKALRKDVAVKSELNAGECGKVSDTEMYDEADYVYGRYLIENKDKVFCEFLEKERKRMESVLDALKRNGMSETEISKQKIFSEYDLLRQTLLRMH